jgi:hypothetical protein
VIGIAIIALLLFAALLAVLVWAVERTLPPRNSLLKRGKKERQAASRYFSDNFRWPGGGSGF